MTAPPSPQPSEKNNKQRLAGGAGLVFMGRLGALIEFGSLIVFTRLYGENTFGLFVALWAYVKVSAAIADMAMTTALQRFVPRAKAGTSEAIVGYAVKYSFLLGCLFAIAATLAAPTLATLVNADASDAAQLVTIIRIYAWVIPFWTLVEVGTAAIRALRTFGPEIRVRIFYEQGIRLIAATVFAAAGILTYGLFLAHVISVVLAAALALRLIAKHYNLRAVLTAPMTGAVPREMRQYGLSVMPANTVKKLFSEGPVMLLNLLLPGAAGAAAAGYYGIARKIASVLQVVRLTFEYVMAPLAAEKDGKGDRAALQEMYSYATRLSVCVALPFGAAFILARHDILAAYGPSYQAAAAAMAILCLGRVTEAATGPSSAIIEMLGHRLLPPLNAMLGLAVFIALSLILIPNYGVTGAAVSAAIGLNITAILALAQSFFLFRLWPYDHQLLKPAAIASILTAGLIALIPASNLWPVPIGLAAAISGLLFSLAIIIRYGLSEEDAAALGKGAQKIRPVAKSKTS